MHVPTQNQAMIILSLAVQARTQQQVSSNAQFVHLESIALQQHRWKLHAKLERYRLVDKPIA